MESLSKIALNAELAGAIAARHFGSSTQLRSFEELKDGLFNAAALLELSDGAKVVLKAAPPAEVRVLRYERDILRGEDKRHRPDRVMIRGDELVVVDYKTGAKSNSHHRRLKF